MLTFWFRHGGKTKKQFYNLHRTTDEEKIQKNFDIRIEKSRKMDRKKIVI